MPRFRLVAARDGDLVDTIAEWPDEEVAETWAAGLLVLEFGLDSEEFDSLEKIAPETDSCQLEELESDPIANAAIDLLDAMSPMITKSRFMPFLKQDAANLTLISKAADLARVLVTEGYRMPSPKA